MKRDKDLMRLLLMKLESLPLGLGDVWSLGPDDPQIAVEGFSAHQIEYHLNLLREGHYIDCPGSQPMLGITFTGLTERGHDFLDEVAEEEARAVPASDRVVNLNHNSESYAQTIAGLEKLEQAIERSNDYPDPEDKEQKLAELSAGRQLLKSVRVRVTAVLTVLRGPLLWLGKTFAGRIIGQLADIALRHITSLFG